MPSNISVDLIDDDIYLAGERVPRGIYREIETGHEIQFDSEDYLPATLNGRVAAYVRVQHTWGQGQET